MIGTLHDDVHQMRSSYSQSARPNNGQLKTEEIEKSRAYCFRKRPDEKQGQTPRRRKPDVSKAPQRDPEYPMTKLTIALMQEIGRMLVPWELLTTKTLPQKKRSCMAGKNISILNDHVQIPEDLLRNTQHRPAKLQMALSSQSRNTCKTSNK